jgi:hypothetical protein
VCRESLRCHHQCAPYFALGEYVSRCRREILLAVPEFTRGADINLNTRLRLPRAVAIVSSSQLRGVPKAIPPRPRDQGSLLAKGGGPAQSPVWMENSNDAAAQLDALDPDGRMLDNLARNSFEFSLGGQQA